MFWPMKREQYPRRGISPITSTHIAVLKQQNSDKAVLEAVGKAMGQLVRSVAAGRKASVLFRSLKRVEVEYNPYDHKSTTAREFLRRVRTPPVKKANKQLEVIAKPSEAYGGPRIALQYADGFEQNIACAGLKLVDVLDEVERVARWRGETKDPFGELRAERRAHLGL